MPDPFIFDPSRVLWHTSYEGGCRWHTAECPSPIGKIACRGEDRQDVLDGLHETFDQVVMEATAHQRLTWIAAWAREQREPWTPPDEDVYEAFGS